MRVRAVLDLSNRPHFESDLPLDEEYARAHADASGLGLGVGVGWGLGESFRPKLARTPRGLRTVRTGHAYRPPACGTYGVRTRLGRTVLPRTVVITPRWWRRPSPYPRPRPTPKPNP